MFPPTLSLVAHPGTWLESKNTITDNAIFGRILLGEFALTPMLATGIFMVACWGGYQYRRAWKAGGPRWKLWVYGLLAGTCLLTVGFIPLAAVG